MIGGIVTQVKVLPDKVWVDCVEKNSSSKCAVYCERNEKSELIQPGDSFWWQGGYCMWTPYLNTKAKKGSKGGLDYDIRIPKIGFSGVNRPCS